MEKNPNAVVTLQNRAVADGWEGTVTIVPADMREWEAPEQADILVRCGALRAGGVAVGPIQGRMPLLILPAGHTHALR